MKTIGLIGYGNMGGAILDSLMQSAEYKFAVADRSDEKLRNLLLSGREITISLNASEIVEMSDIVIIAVKPQSFKEFAKTLGSTENKLFISVMAGVNTEKMSALLKTKNIIRTMPNLPAQVQAGLTGFYANKAVSAEEKEEVVNILSAFSYPLEVQEEADLNKITALSGSGPAYFFYLTQLLEEKAKSFGFSAEKARVIAESTFLGSARVFSEGEVSAEEWVARVKSPGGTTEKALDIFEEKGLSEAFFAGLEGAKKRGEELS